MVGHVLRFHPVFERLAAAVGEGRVGAVRHIVSTRLGLGRFLGMDAVWDLAPHDLSLVLTIAGEHPSSIETLRRTVLSDETDVADIALRFPSGIGAEIHVSRISPFRDRRFSVIGTEGMLTFDDLAPEGQKLAFHGHRVWRDGTAFAFRSADPDYLETEPGLPLDRELRHFLDCVATRQPPRTGADEAVETVRILETASPRRATDRSGDEAGAVLAGLGRNGALGPRDDAAAEHLRALAFARVEDAGLTRRDAVLARQKLDHRHAVRAAEEPRRAGARVERMRTKRSSPPRPPSASAHRRAS